MNDRELLELFLECKKLNINREEFLEFKKQYANTQYVKDEKPEDIVKPLSALDDLDEDEVLFWSTDYYDELQLKKELQQKHKIESEDLR